MSHWDQSFYCVNILWFHLRDRWCCRQQGESRQGLYISIMLELKISMKHTVVKKDIYFDSLRPSQQFFGHVGTVFLGWTSTKHRIKCLAQGYTQSLLWGSNPQPLDLQSSTLPRAPLTLPRAPLRKESDPCSELYKSFSHHLWLLLFAYVVWEPILQTIWT